MNDELDIVKYLDPDDQRCEQCDRYAGHLRDGICAGCRRENRFELEAWERDQYGTQGRVDW